jgi:hypothetical protein
MNTNTEIDKLIAEYTASKALAKEVSKQMTMLPENVKLIDYLRCPTCQLAYFIDHPAPVIDNWGSWARASRVKRFVPLVKGDPKVRQDCNREFAYDIRGQKPTAVRDTAGNWYEVSSTTVAAVLAMVSCDALISCDSWLTYPVPIKVNTPQLLWKFASKHNKLDDLKKGMGPDKFGELSGKVLTKVLGVKKK